MIKITLLNTTLLLTNEVSTGLCNLLIQISLLAFTVETTPPVSFLPVVPLWAEQFWRGFKVRQMVPHKHLLQHFHPSSNY